MARAVKSTVVALRLLNRGKLFAYRKLKRKERNNANKNRTVSRDTSQRRRRAD